MYIALYRKWRPKRFEDISGQEHITVSLKNQIKANRISHAYLFCGTRGTGKTTAAKILAKAVNCLDPRDGNPCEECESCNAINEGNSIDVFEIDAASNRGIDNIRDLREAVKFTPIGKYKLYIIDEVHMLTNEAFNALLKTLEEPPAYVIFVLATTEPHKLPSTILSRCQRFDFKRIGTKSMTERLRYISKEEEIKIEPEALELIVRNSDGAMRDAISIMDQCSVYSNRNISVEDVSAVLGVVNDRYLFEMADSVLKEDIQRIMMLLNEISEQGKDMQQFAKDLQMHYRNILMADVVEKAEDVIDLSKEKIDLLNAQSKRYSKENILRCIKILSDLTAEMKWSSQPMILLEVALIKMSKLEKDISFEGLTARIAKLEKAIAEGEISVTIERLNGSKAVLSENGACYSDKAVAGESDSLAQMNNIAENRIEIKVENDSEKQSPKFDLSASLNMPEAEKGKEDSKDIKEDIKDRIIEGWDDFVKEFSKKKKITLRTHLSCCKPTVIDDCKVLLCFGNEYNFSKEAVEKGKVKKEIEDLAEQYFGMPIIIKPIFENELKGIAEDDLSSSDETACTSEETHAENGEDNNPSGGVYEYNRSNGADTIEKDDIIDEQYVIDKAIELFGEDLVEIVDE